MWSSFMVHMCKRKYLQAFFYFFLFFIFGKISVGEEIKWQKMTLSCQFQPVTLYLRNCRSYHCNFWYAGVRKWYLHVFFFSFFFFKKKYNVVNIKIILFFIGKLQQLFNKYLFFKFISKCQKEIFRCAPSSSHASNFLFIYATAGFPIGIRGMGGTLPRIPWIFLPPPSPRHQSRYPQWGTSPT